MIQNTNQFFWEIKRNFRKWNIISNDIAYKRINKKLVTSPFCDYTVTSPGDFFVTFFVTLWNSKSMTSTIYFIGYRLLSEVQVTKTQNFEFYNKITKLWSPGDQNTKFWILNFKTRFGSLEVWNFLSPGDQNTKF